MPPPAPATGTGTGTDTGPGFGARLFDLAFEAVEAGIDPELALRETALAYADAVRAAERRAAE